MKNKSTLHTHNAILGESKRYRLLAREAAYLVITGPQESRAKNERLTREHMIRSETYADAARLVANTLKP